VFEDEISHTGVFEEEISHTGDFGIQWVSVGFGWAPEGWHLEVNLVVLIGILRHSRRRGNSLWW